MRPRWLLLGMSVICLLVLFPAAAMSQGANVNAGCGTADIDGQARQDEWANAGRVPLYMSEVDPDEVGGPMPASEVEASDEAQSVRGHLWVMNDTEKLYLATRISLDDAAFHPDWWIGLMEIFFSDEPDALDDQWAAPDCDPFPSEGRVWTLKDGMVPYMDDWFMGASQTFWCITEPLVGVQWDMEPDASLVMEHAFDLNASKLDKVGPGDCFRLGLWVFAEGCELGSGCSIASGNWLWGDGVWPASFDWMLPSFGEVCLDPCQVDFVPETGTILLLGSGLAGLAGYATLRWRTRE